MMNESVHNLIFEYNVCEAKGHLDIKKLIILYYQAKQVETECTDVSDKKLCFELLVKIMDLLAAACYDKI